MGEMMYRDVHVLTHMYAYTYAYPRGNFQLYIHTSYFQSVMMLAKQDDKHLCWQFPLFLLVGLHFMEL